MAMVLSRQKVHEIMEQLNTAQNQRNTYATQLGRPEMSLRSSPVYGRGGVFITSTTSSGSPGRADPHARRARGTSDLTAGEPIAHRFTSSAQIK